MWCSTVSACSATLSPFDDIFCVISKGSDYLKLKGDLTVVHISIYLGILDGNLEIVVCVPEAVAE